MMRGVGLPPKSAFGAVSTSRKWGVLLGSVVFFYIFPQMTSMFGAALFPVDRSASFNYAVRVRRPRAGVMGGLPCFFGSDCYIFDNTSLACVSGICVPKDLGKNCTGNIDCTLFSTCDDGVCVYGDLYSNCTISRNCAPNLTCKNGTCISGNLGSSCVSPLSCSKGLTCSPKTHTCVLGRANLNCAEKSNCMPQLSCNPRTMRCERHFDVSSIFGRIFNTSNPGCIGSSSHVRGVSFMDIVHERVDLRLQLHPLVQLFGSRLRKVDMLCFQDDYARLCATNRHIVNVKGVYISMQDHCAQTRNCFKSREVAMNFKGKCGKHIPITSDVQVTQHLQAFDESALQAVNRECRQISSRPLLWFVGTL